MYQRVQDYVGFTVASHYRQIVRNKSVENLKTPGYRDEGLEELRLIRFQFQVLLKQVTDTQLLEHLEAVTEKHQALQHQKRTVVFTVEIFNPGET